MTSVVPLLLLFTYISFAFCGCYPTPHQCVPDKPLQTNVQWHSCQEYCMKCKGYANGDCVKSFSKLCNGKFECKCSGHKIPESNRPLDRITCLMGI